MAPLAATGWLRIGIIDPGSVNLGGVDADGLPAAPGFVYANSFGDIRHQAAVCSGLRLGPSMAIFEPGWLRTALRVAPRRSAAARRDGEAVLRRRLRVPHERRSAGRRAPFGLPPTVTALDAYCELLDGCGLPWSVAVIGGDLIASEIARPRSSGARTCTSASRTTRASGSRRTSSWSREAVALCADVGRPLATRDEATEILDLPRRGPEPPDHADD